MGRSVVYMGDQPPAFGNGVVAWDGGHLSARYGNQQTLTLDCAGGVDDAAARAAAIAGPSTPLPLLMALPDAPAAQDARSLDRLYVDLLETFYAVGRLSNTIR